MFSTTAFNNSLNDCNRRLLIGNDITKEADTILVIVLAIQSLYYARVSCVPTVYITKQNFICLNQNNLSIDKIF